MSPSQRKRPTSGSGKRQGPGKGPTPSEATRRLGLLVFGVCFVVLLLVVAVTEGVGKPDVPSGDVLLVEEMPGDSGEVSKAKFDHALELAAIGGGEKQAPKPDSPKYEELKDAAVSSMLEALWLEGQAAEMGVTASDQEVSEELAKIKKEKFPNKGDFEKFLKESGFTDEDIDERVKLQIFSSSIEEELQEDPPTPSQDEIEEYYEAAKTTSFAQPETRDVRLIRNKDRKKAEQALEQLGKDNSDKSWDKVAKALSEDTTTKANGGFQEGLTEGLIEEPVNADIFAAPEGKLEGPVKAPQGFYVFEVESVVSEGVKSLKEVEEQIKSELGQRLLQDSFSGFIEDFSARWLSRTICADEYLVEQCGNFKGSGHPATAPPACYEANPKGGLPEACPAPVAQLIPAMPGTVTLMEPKGKQLAQRPRPAGLKEGEGEGLESTIPITPPTP